MTSLHEGRALREFTFEELVNKARAGSIAGWIYPKRNVSQMIGSFSKSRQAALNLWGWVAILTAIWRGLSADRKWQLVMGSSDHSRFRLLAR
jgi:hypothetical protein